MQGTRDIKRRISSVKSTQQITRAMEMVAAAKLRRAQANLVSARPYAAKLEETISRIVVRDIDDVHPLTLPREGGPAYLVLSADRGLSGPYNANLLRFAWEKVNENPGPIAAVGRKARDFFRRREREIVAEFSLQGDEPNYHDAIRIADPLLSYFQEGVFGSLYMIYTEFISPLQQKPRLVPLLPVVTPQEESKGQAQALYLYEPSPAAVLEGLLPRYFRNQVFHALLEAKASEHGARMIAMKSATDNADEMIDKLTLSFNRARQASITQEILEVVNGAQALRG
jgi:F-type H+-transporting ATPase subunit gamma